MGACLIMMSVPILALLSFSLWGRERRLRILTALPTHPDEKVVALLGMADVPDPSLTLKDYLRDRYSEAHSWRSYSVPIIVFHLVYVFGLYWSFLTIDYTLSGAAGGQWKEYSGSALSSALFPAVGFLGASLLTVRYLTWRAIRFDLQPNAFLHFSYRLVSAPFLAFFLTRITELTTGKKQVALLIAFLSGIVPESAYQWLQAKWRQAAAEKSGKEILPLQWIQGLNTDDELRLWEEGITDTQRLAVESIVSLLVNTAYSLDCIIDWKDQAFLCVYVGSEFPKWRNLQIRGAMDVLGSAPAYYKPIERYLKFRAGVSKALGKEEAIVERFIDTVYNDPRVHQLWSFLSRAYPTRPAEPIVCEAAEAPSLRATAEECTGVILTS